MRDGVKLHAVILKPADICRAAALPHPAHALRRATEPAATRSSAAARAGARRLHLCLRRHSRTLQERRQIRDEPPARRPPRPKAIDESTDTYDTVAWLLKNVSGNNGRAGFVGTSYPGFLAMMAGIDPHPAVKAISPQAPMIDVWMGDDFFHNGAFRQSYGYDYVLAMESSKEDRRSELRQGQGRQSHRRIRLLSPARLLCRGCEAIRLDTCCPHGSSFSIIPPMTATGVRAASSTTSNAVTVPTLTVGGYYDQEDMCGPQDEYSTSSRTMRTTRTSSCSALAAWLLGLVFAPSWQSGLRRAHRQGVSRADRGKILRALSEGRARASTSKTRPAFRPAPTPGSATATSRRRNRRPTSLYLEGGGLAELGELDRRGHNQLRQRPRQPRSLSPSAHPAHLQPRARSGSTGSPKISALSPIAKMSPCGSCRCSSRT